MRRIRLAFLLLIAPLVAAPGCGGGNTVWVTGKVLKGGTKYTPPEGQVVNVTFVTLEAKDDSGKAIAAGEPFPAEVNQADMTFTVPGRERRGIPPGKYRVALTQKMTREAFSAARPKLKKGKGQVVDRETDYLDDRFSVETSPIVREVKSSTDLTIDLDRPTDSG